MGCVYIPVFPGPIWAVQYEVYINSSGELYSKWWKFIKVQEIRTSEPSAPSNTLEGRQKGGQGRSSSPPSSLWLLPALLSSPLLSSPLLWCKHSPPLSVSPRDLTLTVSQVRRELRKFLSLLSLLDPEFISLSHPQLVMTIKSGEKMIWEVRLSSYSDLTARPPVDGTQVVSWYVWSDGVSGGHAPQSYNTAYCVLTSPCRDTKSLWLPVSMRCLFCWLK